MTHTKEIHAGWIVIEGKRFEVDFETPIGASKEERDAAFLDALSEIFQLDYLTMGTV